MPSETRLAPPPDEPSGTAPLTHVSIDASSDRGGTVAGEPSGGRPAFGLSLWVCAIVIVADQAAKGLIRASLAPFESRTIIQGVLDFIHVQNTGVAFGILNDLAMNQALKKVLTTALAGLALLGIAFYARQVHHHEKLARLGLSLILGGAVGNLLDRVRMGYVLDYVDVYWRGWHFWAFNIADASITIGAVLVFLDLVLVTRHASHPL